MRDRLDARLNARLEVPSVVQFHDRMLSGEQAASEIDSGDPWFWIAENHRCNTQLWNEEDKARRTEVADAEIVACKRLIDRYNQQRNDAIEKIDEALLAMLGDEHTEGARLNSETAGAMIDRLSILALKIYHMREQTQRTDAGARHIAACEARLQRLMLQRRDLASCLDALLEDARAGRAYFKVYRQFKMYNDPALNPYLYAKQGAPT
jgi:hypothetical protein